MSGVGISSIEDQESRIEKQMILDTRYWIIDLLTIDKLLVTW